MRKATFLALVMAIIYLCYPKPQENSMNAAPDILNAGMLIPPAEAPGIYAIGDTIYPDYVCPDTLIVVNAVGLNKGMKLYDETYDYTEYQLDSIFHTNCRIK